MDICPRCSGYLVNKPMAIYCTCGYSNEEISDLRIDKDDPRANSRRINPLARPAVIFSPPWSEEEIYEWSNWEDGMPLPLWALGDEEEEEEMDYLFAPDRRAIANRKRLGKSG